MALENSSTSNSTEVARCDSIKAKCSRCGDVSLSAIRSEHLCKKCLEIFVNNKFIKRLDGFKVRSNAKGEGPPKMLLPISFGPSSLALLHLLDDRLHKQLKATGRQGFRLVVLHAYAPNPAGGRAGRENIQALKMRYPAHAYYTSSPKGIRVVKSGPSSETLAVQPNDGSCDPKKLSLELPLLDFTASIRSPSLTSELLDIAQTRLIADTAKACGCKIVAWGDSTTRIAERTITEISSGRASNIPGQSGQGQAIYGLKFMFPFRDLLRKEIVAFIQSACSDLLSLSLDPSDSPRALSSTNSTISSLMHRYFESAEETYPSIVTNVVKTVGRLESQSKSGSKTTCSICAWPVFESSEDRLNKDPSTGHFPQVSVMPPSNLCYGCSKSFGNLIQSLFIESNALEPI